MHLREAFTERVLRAYEAAGGAVDDDLLFRVRRLWELREAGLTEDPAEYGDAARKLRAGPILKPLLDWIDFAP